MLLLLRQTVTRMAMTPSPPCPLQHTPTATEAAVTIVVVQRECMSWGIRFIDRHLRAAKGTPQEALRALFAFHACTTFFASRRSRCMPWC